MTVTTPHFGFPTPEGSDPPNGPVQLLALAEAIEDAISIRSSGKSIGAAEQTTNSVTAVELGPPDRCSGIVVPEDGLLKVVFRALVKDTGSGAVLLYVDSTTVKIVALSAAPATQEGPITDSEYQFVVSHGGGLGSMGVGSSAASDGVTTGLIAGSECVIHGLPAGTYDVSVRYKAGGTLSAKDRRLWVWSQAFA